MLGSTEALLAYYLGFGFVIFLGWVAALPTRLLDEPSARRYLRGSTIAAVIGLLHPAIALAARDIVSQVGIDLPATDTGLRRTTAITNALAALSLIAAAAVIALNVV